MGKKAPQGTGQASERAARVAAMKKEQARKENRRRAITGVAIAVALSLGAGIIAIAALKGGGNDVELDEAGEMAGVKSTTPDAGHVSAEVKYDTTPPMGGQHDQAWVNCKVYDAPIRNENGVHALEHGAVWITYRPDLPEGDVEKLEDFVRRQPLVVVTVKGVRRETNERYILMSPFPGLPAPVVISSWAHQLRLDSPDDPRLQRYVDTFRVSEKYSPEYGPTCKGQPAAIGGKPAFD